MSVDTEKVFKDIKKQNGEMFARVMRGDSSAIPEDSPFRNVNLLDTPDLVNMLRYAGKNPNDAILLIPVVKERRDKSFEKQEIKQESFEDPIKLLDRAGYNAFYVKTLKQQNSIKKYFKPGEELCTFNEPDRYKRNYIIHAVKKNVNDIKRSKHPEREDEYGTSVISIQILKTGGAISIKNRYNHTVNNPDHTFNDNPDNIISGLSMALKHKFGVDFTVSNSKIPENYRLINNQLVRFYYEFDNVYFGDRFYLDGSCITELDDKHEVMFDNIVLNTDFGKKTRSVLNIPDKSTDELVRVINDEIAGCKVTKSTEKGEIIISIIDENKKKKELLRTKDDRITSLHLYRTKKLGDNFLLYNKVLSELDASKLEYMGSYCFEYNQKLETLNMTGLKQMGICCFGFNKSLKKLDVSKLEYMGKGCFNNNEKLETLNISKLEIMGDGCFENNNSLKELNGPILGYMGSCCFEFNEILETLNVPELKEMGDGCFENNNSLKELNAEVLENAEKHPFIKRFFRRKKIRQKNVLFKFETCKATQRDVSILKDKLMQEER